MSSKKLLKNPVLTTVCNFAVLVAAFSFCRTQEHQSWAKTLVYLIFLSLFVYWVQGSPSWLSPSQAWTTFICTLQFRILSPATMPAPGITDCLSTVVNQLLIPGTWGCMRERGSDAVLYERFNRQLQLSSGAFLPSVSFSSNMKRCCKWLKMCKCCTCWPKMQLLA